MKPLMTALILVLVLNVLAAMGFVGWLTASGRLSRERVRQVVDIFEPTLMQAAQQEQQAAQLAQQTQELAQQAARLETVADGPMTLQERLAQERQSDEIALLRVRRVQRESQDLRQQIEAAKDLIAKQKAELEAQKKAFEDYLAQETQRIQDEDFQQTVRMYEQLKADQVKQMFKELLAAGQQEQVVRYLAAMQLRKAANVLEEFEEPEELVQATQLMEMLRQQGVDPLGTVAGGLAKP